jgi:hypothetical protein
MVVSQEIFAQHSRRRSETYRERCLYKNLPKFFAQADVLQMFSVEMPLADTEPGNLVRQFGVW